MEQPFPPQAFPQQTFPPVPQQAIPPQQQQQAIPFPPQAAPPQQQPATQQQISDTAVRVGLPPDTPGQILETLQTFLRLVSQKKGVNKRSKEEVEAMERMKEVLMNYMDAKNVSFLDIPGMGFYTIVKKLTPLSYSDDVVGQAFYAFMSQPHPVNGNNLPELTKEFVEFCRDGRKRNGKTERTLELKKTRPVAEIFRQSANAFVQS